MIIYEIRAFHNDKGYRIEEFTEIDEEHPTSRYVGVGQIMTNKSPMPLAARFEIQALSVKDAFSKYEAGLEKYAKDFAEAANKPKILKPGPHPIPFNRMPGGNGKAIQFPGESKEL